MIMKLSDIVVNLKSLQAYYIERAMEEALELCKNIEDEVQVFETMKKLMNSGDIKVFEGALIEVKKNRISLILEDINDDVRIEKICLQLLEHAANDIFPGRVSHHILNNKLHTFKYKDIEWLTPPQVTVHFPKFFEVAK